MDDHKNLSEDKRKHDFTITTKSGAKIEAKCAWGEFGGKVNHLEFYGAITTTGYRSHFFFSEEDRKSIVAYATEIANDLERKLQAQLNPKATAGQQSLF